MSAAELAALLVFCTAMSFSPGPNTTLSTALAANFGLSAAGAEVTPQDWSNLAAALPEPGGAALFVMTMSLTIPRPRRRRG